MSESLILVALVGLLGLMIVAIVAIVAFVVARGSFYGWRRRRLSVNTVQPVAHPVDCVTQAQLQDLEKRLAASQANADKRLAAIDGRLGALESIVANHGAMIATLRQLVNDLRNDLLQLQRTVTSNRTMCNLRHVVHAACCRFDLRACAIAIAVVWALIAFIGLLSFGWFAGLLLGACCGIAAGIIAGCVIGHISNRRGVVS